MTHRARAGPSGGAKVRTGLVLTGLLAALVLVPLLRERGSKPAGVAASPASGRAATTREPAASAANVIDVASLLLELVDLPRLARSADPPYSAHLASSYDLRSRKPADPDGWFANDDWASAERPNYVRVEERAGRREYVLLDTQGPGAIVRFWTAGPAGTLRVYVDGAAEPVLTARMSELLSGAGDFPRALAYVAARGFNAYFPLPFAKSCKVTVDDLITTDPFRGGALAKFYYQLNYRLYGPEARDRVRSYQPGAVAAATAEIARVSEILERPASAYVPTPGRALLALTPTATGARLSIDGEQSGAVREMVVRTRDTSESALARATLTLDFDGQRTASLPLGDFFGGGPGLAPYSSLPFEIRADGTFVSRWVMPFAKRMSVELHECPGCEGELSLEPDPWTPASLYFHAYHRPRARVKTLPYSDLNLLHAAGRGTYVGTAFAIDNGSNERWWGEGDERIYVDGQSFPDLFGTGTEDYFGFAWSTTELFARPFHAQTRAEGPGFRGRAAMNRFHVVDAIPFTRSLRFDLELWHWENTEVTWQSVAYWYGR